MYPMLCDIRNALLSTAFFPPYRCYWKSSPTFLTVKYWSTLWFAKNGTWSHKTADSGALFRWGPKFPASTSTARITYCTWFLQSSAPIWGTLKWTPSWWPPMCSKIWPKSALIWPICCWILPKPASSTTSPTWARSQPSWNSWLCTSQT